MKKRLLAAVLVLLLVLQLVPAVFAAEDSYSYSFSMSPRRNPLIPNSGSVSAQRWNAGVATSPTGYPVDSYISDFDQLVEQVREGLTERQGVINFRYRSQEEISDEFLDELFYAALEETGVPYEGDYLRWVWDQYGADGTIAFKDGYYYSDMSYQVTYYTTAEQEAAADTMVDELIDSFEYTNSSDEYEKILEIYRWLCDEVVYDEENLDDPNYLLKYTAYAAIADRTAVCQGYATLFYRLALESGLEARVITGTSFGGNHAWNIVKLYGQWYLLDSTWDAGIKDAEDYEYFLKGTDDFSDHDFEKSYLTEPFISAYPISAENYDPSTPTPHEHSLHYLSEEAPGCTEPGQRGGAVCTGCGQLIEQPEEIAPLGHDWDGGSVSKEPSESEEGEMLFTCSRCGETKTEKIDKLPGDGEHVHVSEVIPRVEPACLKDGATEGSRCALCGEVLTAPQPIRGLNHNFENCTCTICGMDENAYVPMDEGVSWDYDTKTGTLTIRGKGSMGNFGQGDAPWDEHFLLMKKIVIEEGITAVGSNAFQGANRVTELVLPDSLYWIGARAFQGLSRITELSIPEGVEIINQGAFDNCASLTSVRLPENTKSIKQMAFCNCWRLEELYIPDSVEEIGTWAFQSTKLKEFRFPASLKILGNEILYDVKTLKEASFPEGFSKIPDGTFKWCAGLESITIPEGVTEIGEGAFANCSSLKTIELPESLERMGAGVFDECTGLEELRIPEGVGHLDMYALGNCKSLKKLWLPSSISRIENYAVNAYQGVGLEVFFAGSKQQWEKVLVGQFGNDYFHEAVFHFDASGAPQSPFVDVKATDYFYQGVIWAVDKGVTTGVSSTSFAPGSVCTRAQVVTFLWRAAGEPAPESSENPFTDVSEGAYYYNAVLWAVEKGITTGTSATTFSPSAPCNRAQVVTFLWRANEKPPVPDGNYVFYDLDINAYYFDAVLWSIGKGITQGTAQGWFSPSTACNRGQIVTFLYRDSIYN